MLTSGYKGLFLQAKFPHFFFYKINKHIPGLVHKVMSEIQHEMKERLYNVGNIIINWSNKSL